MKHFGQSFLPPFDPPGTSPNRNFGFSSDAPVWTVPVLSQRCSWTWPRSVHCHARLRSIGTRLTRRSYFEQCGAGWRGAASREFASLSSPEQLSLGRLRFVRPLESQRRFEGGFCILARAQVHPWHLGPVSSNLREQEVRLQAMSTGFLRFGPFRDGELARSYPSQVRRRSHVFPFRRYSDHHPLTSPGAAPNHALQRTATGWQWPVCCTCSCL